MARLSRKSGNPVTPVSVILWAPGLPDCQVEPGNDKKSWLAGPSPAMTSLYIRREASASSARHWEVPIGRVTFWRGRASDASARHIGSKRGFQVCRGDWRTRQSAARATPALTRMPAMSAYLPERRHMP
jgi:hypothetical protein